MTESSPDVPPVKPENRTAARRRRWLFLALICFVAVGVAYWLIRGRLPTSRASTGRSKASEKSAPATPVIAARARRGNIGVYFNGLGAVTPVYTVIVKSRVDGQLENVHYREGDYVQQGDLLIEIDPRPFQVQLEQAEGQLLRDQALLENARLDL